MWYAWKWRMFIGMVESSVLLFALKAIAVFGMGATPWFEIWTAVPLGVIMGLSPAVATVAAVTGNIVSVAVMVAVLPRLKDWIAKRFLPDQADKPDDGPVRQKRFYYLWKRYGVPGTALGAPLLIGTHLATALCIILGTSTRRVMLWITISIVVWGMVVAITCHLGLEGFKHIS